MTEQIENTVNPLSKAIFTINQMDELEMPVLECYLAPWFVEYSIIMVAGYPGVGKSWWTMALLSALSQGKSFGPWEGCGKPLKCLYFDAEMPIQTTRNRAKAIGMDGNVLIYNNMYAVINNCRSANLFNPFWRNAMCDLLLDNNVQVWVLDNVSNAVSSYDDNSAQAWDPIRQWTKDLTTYGISTIMVEHTGKDGDSPRGTIAKIGNVDACILLKPKSKNVANGCNFHATFGKTRNDPTLCAPTTWKLELNRSDVWNWNWTSNVSNNFIKDPLLDKSKIEIVLNQDMQPADIVKEYGEQYGINYQDITRAKKRIH